MSVLDLPAPPAWQKPQLGSRLRAGYWPGTPSRWLFNEGAGKTAFDIGGNRNDIALSAAGVAWTPTPLGVGTKFDGSSGSGSVKLNLANTSAITLIFTASYAAIADQILFEFSTNYNNVLTGFLIDQGGGAGGTFTFGVQSANGYTIYDFTSPTVGVLHRYVITIDKTQLAANCFHAWVDGIPQSLTGQATNNPAGTFANDTLYIASRAGTSVFDACTLVDLRILPYSIANLPAEAVRLYAAPYDDIQPRRYTIPVGGAAAVPSIVQRRNMRYGNRVGSRSAA